MLWETAPTVLLVAVCGGSLKCMRACVSEFVCTRARACDSSVGWVGWGTLVICWSHTVLSPPCPRLAHTKHAALIARPVGLRPGDRESLRPTGVCILRWCQVTSRTIQWLTSKITLEKKKKKQIQMVWTYFLRSITQWHQIQICPQLLFFNSTLLAKSTGGKTFNCKNTTKSNVISERLVVAFAFICAYQSRGCIMPGLMIDLQFIDTLML